MTNPDSHVEILREFRERIYDRGSSHSPEIWTIASEIDEYIDALEDGADHETLIAKAQDQQASATDWIYEEAPKVVIAVLTDAVDSAACNGCGETLCVDTDGYCYYCREVYDRKPDDV